MREGLALARFEAGIRLINNVNLATAAHRLTIWVTVFQAFKRCCYFHGWIELKGKRKEEWGAGVNGKRVEKGKMMNDEVF